MSRTIGAISMSCDQYNLDPLERLDKKRFRDGMAEHFPEGPVRKSIQTDIAMIEACGQQI